MIAILGDLHFGARSNSKQFDNYFKESFEKQFFSVIDKNNISTLICLGDIFDVRKNVNFEILESCKRYFFDELLKRGIKTYIIVGNHDSYFKDTVKVNSPSLLLKEYENIVIVDEPGEYFIDKTKFLLMPWICDDNLEESMRLLQKSDAKYCAGHFEIAGFQMYKGIDSHGGLEPIIFNRFKKVFSGHYHTSSKKGNIFYTGVFCEMTWSDYNDPKGFHLFDTETGKTEFILNSNNMFFKYNYSEDDTETDFSWTKDKIVRIETNDIKDKSKFDKFIQSIQKENPSDLKISNIEVTEKADTTELIATDDTRTILSEYIDSIETELDKDLLKSMLNAAYVKAIQL